MLNKKVEVVTWLYLSLKSHYGARFTIETMSRSAKKAMLVQMYGISMAAPIKPENENLEFFSLVRAQVAKENHESAQKRKFLIQRDILVAEHWDVVKDLQ